MTTSVLAVAISLGGCDKTSNGGQSEGPASSNAASSSRAAGLAANDAPAFIAAGPDDRVRSPETADWPGDVEWHGYDDGLAIAKQSKKPIMLFVHADWCSKCRALKPIFAQAEFEKLAKDFVMVQQDADQDPPWLEALNQQYGSYVPRIFFMNADGTVREELKSPSQRYPYFYTAGQASQLEKSMRSGLGAAG